VHIWQRLGVASPGDQFLQGDEVDVGKSEDGVDELKEAILAVGPVEEPGRVEEEGEGRLALGVVLQEVLGEDLLDSVRLLSVETLNIQQTVTVSDGMVTGLFPYQHSDIPTT
jgi:hypothetical protein